METGKPTARLENWYVYCCSRGVLLCGEVFGHNRLTDGHGIHTSLVVALHNDTTAETLNTVYTLGKPAGDGELDRLKNVLEDYAQ